MKHVFFVLTFSFIHSNGNAQSLLNLNEYETVRESQMNEIVEPLDDEKSTNTKDSLEKKPYPAIAFGTNLTTGTDAVGFRPSLAAGTDIIRGVFGMSASLQFTQVDDQRFDTEKTGQTLFIPEISNFSANLSAMIGIPNLKFWENIKTKKDSIDPRFGISLGIKLRGNSLFNLDSTTYRSEENDIFSFHAFAGLEIVLMRDYISAYCNLNYLSITNNRDTYHAYFPSNAVKDFWYFQPGFKFLAVEGLSHFKGLVIDVSAIMLSKNMRTIAGYQNTIIPVIKVGYTQKIGWKNVIENQQANAKKRANTY